MNQEFDVMDKFVAVFAYSILAMLLILSADEIWYWGEASPDTISREMHAALWVVAVRIAAFWFSGLLSSANRLDRVPPLRRIALSVLAGTVVLTAMNVVSGDSVAPGIGILIIDSVLNFLALYIVGMVFLWRRA